MKRMNDRGARLILSQDAVYLRQACDGVHWPFPCFLYLERLPVSVDSQRREINGDQYFNSRGRIQRLHCC